MLAMGWNIERSKEGEAMFQQREGDKQKTSDPQVKSSERILLLIHLILHSALDIKRYV